MDILNILLNPNGTVNGTNVTDLGTSVDDCDKLKALLSVLEYIGPDEALKNYSITYNPATIGHGSCSQTLQLLTGMDPTTYAASKNVS